ncbi:TPA: thioredoxin, partial [Enterococcus faecium]
MNKKEYLGIILIALASISIILFLYSNNRELKKANTMLQLEKQVLIDNTDSFEYLNSITVDTFENRIKNK